MLPRGLPLLFVCVLAGCRDGNSLEDFSNRTLRIQVTPVMEDSEFEFSAQLARDEPEAGCKRLDSGVTATLNGEPIMVFPGSATPDPDGPCGSPPIPPVFVLRGSASRFAGGPRDALLEIRDGDARIVAEFRNLIARHTLARPEAPLKVKPGQEVFLAWDPPTDELPGEVNVQLGDGDPANVTYLKATPEPGGLRITLPTDLPAGSRTLWARPLTSPRAPQVRCEGVESCGALISMGRQQQQQIEVLVEP